KAPQILTSKSDATVADWVQSIGGKAVMEGGHLTEISFRGATVSDAQLKNLESLRTLKTLVLDGAEIGDLGARSLATLPGLTALSLKNTGISDAGLAHIGQFGSLEKLSLD